MHSEEKTRSWQPSGTLDPKKVYKTVFCLFFFLPFLNAFFSSPLVFSPSVCPQIFQSGDSSLWSPSLLFCFPLCSVVKRSVWEGLAVASSEEESSFYRRTRCGAPSLEAWGVCLRWGGLLLLSGWGGVCVCVCVCICVFVCVYGRCKRPPTRFFFFNQWCGSRQRTTGEALAERLLI